MAQSHQTQIWKSSESIQLHRLIELNGRAVRKMMMLMSEMLFRFRVLHENAELFRLFLNNCAGH